MPAWSAGSPEFDSQHCINWIGIVRASLRTLKLRKSGLTGVSPTSGSFLLKPVLEPHCPSSVAFEAQQRIGVFFSLGMSVRMQIPYQGSMEEVRRDESVSSSWEDRLSKTLDKHGAFCGGVA